MQKIKRLLFLFHIYENPGLKNMGDRLYFEVRRQVVKEEKASKRGRLATRKTFEPAQKAEKRNRLL